MATHFDRWEKDPFFSAAEEVQESADRMESTYRTWIHSMKDSPKMWNSEELRRDLQTALGTTKWQLEEFERAVKSSYTNSSADDAKERHRQFVVAIDGQILRVETSLRESAISDGKAADSWVHLDEGECNELAMFLSGRPTSSDKTFVSNEIRAKESMNTQKDDEQSTHKCSNHLQDTVELNLVEVQEEKFPAHRRTASASADIGAWKIAVADDVLPQSLSSGQPGLPPRKMPSFSGFLSTMESASKLKWQKNGYRKLKNQDHHQEADSTLSQTQLTKGINNCYERSKSCLDGCDDCYDKQLYGWHGAIQRLLQRSQYQMQYSRPLQIVFWIFLLFCLIVLFALRAI
ncbi:uncharacterized protein LOC127800073 isoform X1 [Diospyros lotus]|uniref:uncharacterized protein LOC127800073 isoform X1 n=1 Tax=Diospyros lotus TaxID=55363 RepID=UPI0022563E01|nr:uncharacterized protein LOC127800073 isoform X1 [Diospyros lotus]